jgi:hypothetical protein
MVEPYKAAEERNIFEIDNARNQYERQLPATFVSTAIFWRLFSPKNQILVGTRGSGKTAILKMLTLPYLINFDNEEAVDLVDRRAYIGIYVPITTLWLGPIKSRDWSSAEEKGREFLWHLSIAACQAFTKTVEAALTRYINDERRRLEATAAIVKRLSFLWFGNQDGSHTGSLKALRDRLGDLPLEKNLFEASQFLDPYGSTAAKYGGGARFYSPVLDALLYAINFVEEILTLEQDKVSWLICLDEVETLDEDCQAIINSFMRSDFGNRYFKIATLPYAHKTLRTNLDAPLQAGNDFEYLWIDDDPATHDNLARGAVASYSSYSFARELYNKRRQTAGGSYGRWSLDRLLGKNSILSPVEFIEKGQYSRERSAINAFDDLAPRHFNQKTAERALRLREASAVERPINNAFGDQLLRKTLGLLLLRDAVTRKRGSSKLEIYSGSEMLVRLADGNARTLIRLLNSILRPGGWSHSRSNPIVSRTQQHEAAVRFSRSIVERVRSEEEVGQSLHNLLMRIGNGIASDFLGGRIGTDFVGQVTFDPTLFARFRQEIVLGMQLGLLRVDMKPGTDFVLPTASGTFRLSYCLSPAFNLMPRRGRPGSFQSVVGSRTVEQPFFDFGALA